MFRVRKWLNYVVRNPNTLEVIGWKDGTPQAIKDEYQKEIEDDKKFEEFAKAEVKKYGY